MEGVPFVSPGQFTAEGKWELVEEDGQTRVSTFCRVDWHKKPGMITPKGQIDKGTVDGFEEFFALYKRYLMRALANAGGGSVEEEAEEGVPGDEGGKAAVGGAPSAWDTKHMAMAGGIALLLLLVLLLWWSRWSWMSVAEEREGEIADLTSRIEILEAEVYHLGQVVLDVRAEAPAGVAVAERWMEKLRGAHELLSQLQSDFADSVIVTMGEGVGEFFEAVEEVGTESVELATAVVDSCVDVAGDA
jgi:hypothetical protein